jgi:hypothetical protein
MTTEIPSDLQKLIAIQGGVVARLQTLSAGFNGQMPRNRLRYGHWQRMQRGVYATYTGDPSREAELWAALLRAGIDDAVLSHYTAAERHGILKEASHAIHVTVPEKSNPARYGKIPGVIIHRSNLIAGTRHPAMVPPCTRVEDTVLDILKVTRDFDAKYGWVCKAISGRHTTPERLLARLTERKRYPSREDVKLMLGYAAEGILSWLELQWTNGVERPHGLPAAQHQVRVAQATGNKYLDNLYEYRGIRLCVEVDGMAAHPESEQGRDKERDRRNLVEHGILTLRFESKDLRTKEQKCVAAVGVARVLSRASGSDGSPGRVGHPCSPVCPVPSPHPDSDSDSDR